MDDAAAGAALELAEEIAPGLRGLERGETFARLGDAEGELVAALEWFVAEGRAEETIRLTRALAPYWQASRRLEDATAWFDRALTLPAGDAEQRGRALCEAGFLWFLRGEDERASALLQQATELGRGLERPTVSALALTAFARIALRRGDLEEARRLALEAFELSERGDDPIGRGSAAHVLGVTAQMQGELLEARRWMTERIDRAREDGNYAALGMEASNLSMVERQLGDLERADALAREALDNFRRRRDEWAYSFGLNGLAAIEAARGSHERAATLIGAADARIEEQGAAWPPDEQVHYDETVAALTAALGAVEFERLRSLGAALSADEAVAYALAAQ